MHSVTTSFLLLVDGYAYSLSFCEFFCEANVNTFSWVNLVIRTSLGEYFSATTL